MRRSPSSFAHRRVKCFCCSVLTLSLPTAVCVGRPDMPTYAWGVLAVVSMSSLSLMVGQESFVLRLLAFARDAFVAWCNRKNDKT